MNNIIQAEIPEQLCQQAELLIQQGWASNLQEIINDALRRYLESHQELLTEAFIQEDVEWGLRGND
jgi:hypothetical protein